MLGWQGETGDMNMFVYFLIGDILFVAQLLIAELIFIFGRKRRERFVRRVGCTAAASAAITALVSFAYGYFTTAVPGLMMFFGIAVYLLLFVMTLAAIAVCYEIKFAYLAAAGIAGYAAQHMVYNIFNIVTTSTGMLSFALSGIGSYMIFVVVQCGVYALGYLLIYMIFARKASYPFSDGAVNGPVLVLSSTMLAVVLVFNSVRTYFSYESLGLDIVCCMYSVVCCVFILVIRAGLFARTRLKLETDVLKRLMKEERRQFELTKEHIDMINLKCHDIRHKINEYGNAGKLLTQEEVDELKRYISVYDAVFKTGNDTLDIVLTERSLYCERNGIKLTCSANGGKLNFMSAADIGSFFCNAVDNAIDAVGELDDADKRVIGIVVKEAAGQLSVLVENWYEGNVTFADGMPVTKKGDKNSHGYGVLSMKMITEKYGGSLSFETEGNIFRLMAIFPLP